MNKNNEKLLFEVGFKNGKLMQIIAESYSIINIIDVGLMYVFGKEADELQCNYCINDINYHNFNAIININDVSYIIRID